MHPINPLARCRPGQTSSGHYATGEQPGDIRVMVRVLQPGSASRRARAILREVLQDTGLDDDAIADAELVVAELAANAEKHARPPYELRIISLDAVPTWCEISDGDPDLHEIRIIFNLLHSVDEIGLPLLAENGRGLLLAHRLSHGHCHVLRHHDPHHRHPRQGRHLRPAHPPRQPAHLPTPPRPRRRPRRTQQMGRPAPTPLTPLTPETPYLRRAHPHRRYGPAAAFSCRERHPRVPSPPFISVALPASPTQPSFYARSG